MKDLVYISFYNNQDQDYRKLKPNLTLLMVSEIMNYLDGVENKHWCIVDTELRHFYNMVIDIVKTPLLSSEILLGVYLDENDAILFKLKFGL